MKSLQSLLKTTEIIISKIQKLLYWLIDCSNSHQYLTLSSTLYLNIDLLRYQALLTVTLYQYEMTRLRSFEYL